MTSKKVSVELTEINSLVGKALKLSGYTDEEISVIKEVILYAQYRGNNQGIVKLTGPGLPKSPGMYPFPQL